LSDEELHAITEINEAITSAAIKNLGRIIIGLVKKTI